jgi:hypothetical protein
MPGFPRIIDFIAAASWDSSLVVFRWIACRSSEISLSALARAASSSSLFFTSSRYSSSFTFAYKVQSSDQN